MFITLKEKILIILIWKIIATLSIIPKIIPTLLQIILNTLLTYPVRHSPVCTSQSIASISHIYADEVNMALNHHER